MEWILQRMSSSADTTGISAIYLQGKDITRLASMAKLKSGRLVRETADTCLQYWDGMDFTDDVFISTVGISAMYLQGKDITRLASMAKLKSGRLVRETADTCLQYWDGMDFTDDVFISRYYRDFSLVRDITRLASMAKLKSGRLVRETADTCLQYWDGMGFTEDV
ncbi:uncharacterized protein [Ptychodera flava]|uniref:uncharacterized protein n=1 Tax=Ptychodera flava TaxID=63121 RepID=UPI00396A2F93